MLKINVSLVEGVDRHEFSESFPSDSFKVYYFSDKNLTDLLVLVDFEVLHPLSFT
jgi:hypothetical protein